MIDLHFFSKSLEKSSLATTRKMFVHLHSFSSLYVHRTDEMRLEPIAKGRRLS